MRPGCAREQRALLIRYCRGSPGRRRLSRGSQVVFFKDAFPKSEAALAYWASWPRPVWIIILDPFHLYSGGNLYSRGNRRFSGPGETSCCELHISCITWLWHYIIFSNLPSVRQLTHNNWLGHNIFSIMYCWFELVNERSFVCILMPEAASL